jgi:hypothetical protein
MMFTNCVPRPRRPSLRSPATQAAIAFPGHAGRGQPLPRWRSVARNGGAGARSLATVAVALTRSQGREVVQ